MPVVHQAIKVALYTSAWIEIPSSFWVILLSFVALYTSAWIEIFNLSFMPSTSTGRTLHECVDWNSLANSSSDQLYRSHSTRVRGLKYHYLTLHTDLLRSHSTRVRGLKSLFDQFKNHFIQSHSTRVRGLKFISPFGFRSECVSHSTRVRGLK